jgi:hypothetical protein
LRYTGWYSRGPKTVNLNLTIAPEAPPSPGALRALPADISAPGNDAPQSLRPIPVCAALAP